jgi:hypothetical protein
LAEQLKALLPDELFDELLAGARTEEEITGPGGLLSQLTKRLVERALGVELSDHLGDEPHQEPPGGAGKFPERVDAEDVDQRAGRGADRDAAGRSGDVRAADREEAAAALRGVRREALGAVRPWLVDPGDRGASGGDLRGSRSAAT